MSARIVFPSERTDRRYRRALWWGLSLSAGFHVALLLAWRADLSPYATTVAAGPRTGDPTAAAGGSVMQAIRFAPPREIVVPPPPTSVPDVVLPEVEIEPPAEPPVSIRTVDLRGSLAGSGPARGPGVEAAGGTGDGGADAEGYHRLTAPEVRSIYPEWDPPESVRGMEVTVRVLVAWWGEPLDVELRPPTPDARFNKRLASKALQMDYAPAHDRLGRPVTAWAEFTQIF
ncbi:MAG: hypothetical protein ACE5HF_00280 [Gemmatimonadota bacterium]